jgi:hypothetical protein
MQASASGAYALGKMLNIAARINLGGVSQEQAAAIGIRSYMLAQRISRQDLGGLKIKVTARFKGGRKPAHLRFVECCEHAPGCLKTACVGRGAKEIQHATEGVDVLFRALRRNFRSKGRCVSGIAESDRSAETAKIARAGAAADLARVQYARFDAFGREVQRC